MSYEDLIQTISIMVDEEKIYKKGLTLVYQLDEENHKKMNQELFLKSNPVGFTFTPVDEFEVELGGILIKFVKDIPKNLE